jgi:GntR family transcriptional repressor for pyruvate dehydrogenase complex
MTVTPSFVPQALTTKGAAAQIADQLREAIASGVWNPGDRLPPEWQLAQTYGVSRGTVREALRLVAANNLINSVRGAAGGTFVVVPGADTVAGQIGDFIVLRLRAGDLSVGEVNHARRLLERECVRLAAINRTEADLAAIWAPIERVAADPFMDTGSWLAADVDFHTAIAVAAKNGIIELAMTAVHLVRPRTNTLLLGKLEKEPVWQQHEAIYRAIEAQDPNAAVAALEAHVDYLSSVQASNASDDAGDLPLADLSPEGPPQR